MTINAYRQLQQLSVTKCSK